LGQVEAFEIDGLKLWINSSDHLPPHFHAKRRGQWEIRVFFLTCTDKNLDFNVKFQFGKKGPSAADQAAILELVLEHRAALLQEWEKKVCKSD
jgi:hypothetical protein